MTTIDKSTAKSAQETEYGIPIRNLWYMLLYAWNETPHSPYWKMVDDEESPTLDALLASALAKMLQQRLRIGLGCTYMPEQRPLRGIRGRIHVSMSLKRRAFERGQTFCEFEEFSINAPKNQIIRSTLHYLAQMGEFGSENAQTATLRHRARWLVRALDGVDLIELTPDVIFRQQVQRHDHDYRIMLAICDFILRRRMPTEQAGQAFISRLERERYVLHRLYQDFVTNFYRHHLWSWTISREKVLDWHDGGDNAYLPKMRPDLILEQLPDERMIVLDTKFTARSLIQNQWGKAMFDSSHLYQIYAYLKTQEHLTESKMGATGILLYPAIREELSEKIVLPRQSIRIECVNLAADWPDIEKRLLNLIADDGAAYRS